MAEKYLGFGSSSMSERGRTNVRTEREIFAPRKKMSKDKYESIKSWLVDTAETPQDKRKLKSDLARLEAAYKKSQKPKISGTASTSKPKAKVTSSSKKAVGSLKDTKASRLVNLPRKTATPKGNIKKK